MKPTVIAAVLAVVAALSASASAADAVPAGWTVQGSKPQAYSVRVDPSQKGANGNAVLIESKGESGWMGALGQSIKADDYRGKRVRLSGWIKGKGVKSWAGLWMRVTNIAGVVTAFDNMETRAFRGDGDWKKFEIVLDVDSVAATIDFGALLSGTGKAWVSGIALETVDSTVAPTVKRPEMPRAPVNLGFN